MSEAQEEMIRRHFRGASLFIDGDKAGREATDNLLLRLGRRIWAHAAMLPDRVRQDAMTVEEIRKALW